MTASRTRKQRGHETEATAAAWFRANGWPYAEPVGAGRGGTDVTGMPGLVCEVKARREFRPVEWLKQHALRRGGPRRPDRSGGPVMATCRCQDCEPDLHAECSADCLVYDCGSSWACCNSDCDMED